MKKKINVPYVDIAQQWKREKKDLIKIIDQTLSTGNYVGGDEINKFENNIEKKIGIKNCVALNSGTDALTFGLYVLGVGRDDEVITTPNSFIASTASIVHLGAKPVFVDVKDDQNINPKLIENKITKKTKAIMPVHLTGRVCDMEKIMKISKKYKIPVIEDAAQSIGSKYNNKFSGTFSSIGCFSAHPLKNLNAMGDSGYLVTNNNSFAKLIRDLRNHGMTNRNRVCNFGYVSRMDNLQAAILNYRLAKLDNVINKRRENAKVYFNYLNSKNVFVPEEKKEEFNTYHTFVVQVKNRNALQKYLLEKGINTSIHYPIPIHLQKASSKYNYKIGSFKKTEKQAKTILSLPINENLTKLQIRYVCDIINKFYIK
tara:strand:+ start:1186 stop:2298 length:1113 start_codon:yes stop_codon:yes gene_type:complete